MHAPIIVLVLGDERLGGVQVFGELYLTYARGFAQPRQALSKGLLGGWWMFALSRHHGQEVYPRFGERLACSLTNYHR